MKYVVILGDGMADYPDKCQGGSPLQVANKPYIDSLCKKSEVGLCKTIPNGMKPGSDVANLSVLGYDVEKVYTGRSPLEAASIGINLKDTDVTARANLVTLSNEEDFSKKIMVDYSAGEISTKEAKELIEYLANYINGSADKKLYTGISYRHCLVMENGQIAGDLTPPHDITGKVIGEHLPKSDRGQFYLDLIKKSYELLKNHPINIERAKNGKNPANALWFWGEGTKPKLESFYSVRKVKGAMISAVDLLKGIAKLTDMQVIEVEGATGNYDTNFNGKANACIEALKNGIDFVYIHVEAPDECGHHGDMKNKIYSIEQIDDKIVKPVVEYLENSGESFRVLICPDHPTPISIRTHCSDEVPYLLYDSQSEFIGKKANSYNEICAKQTGNYLNSGIELMDKLLKN